MAKLPMFPMWVRDYLADTRHLSDAEHGRYHLILYELWAAPRQRLPNDDDWLARRFARDADRVRTELRPLIREFCQTDQYWIRHKRLTKEWNYAQHICDQRRKAAKARWDKEKEACKSNAHLPYPTKTLTHEGQVIPNALADAASAVLALAKKSKERGSA